VQQASTAWLTVAGLAAAVAAYLIALPVLRRREPP
jgi:ABC-type branched-subunit amino acid transport system permease subunit